MDIPPECGWEMRTMQRHSPLGPELTRCTAVSGTRTAAENAFRLKIIPSPHSLSGINWMVTRIYILIHNNNSWLSKNPARGFPSIQSPPLYTVLHLSRRRFLNLAQIDLTPWSYHLIPVKETATISQTIQNIEGSLAKVSRFAGLGIFRNCLELSIMKILWEDFSFSTCLWV